MRRGNRYKRDCAELGLRLSQPESGYYVVRRGSKIVFEGAEIETFISGYTPQND